MLKKEPSVYLLAGSEELLKEKNLAEIKSVSLDKACEDFNFNTFYAGSAAPEKILECAGTAPFLGRKRVVLVRRIEDFPASGEELILSYIKAPHKQTLLILETSQNNLKQNFFAEICKYAQVVFCKPLKENQVLDWLKGEVQARGKRIEEAAIRLLVSNIGNNLQALSSSLDKLVLYTGGEETIEAEAVEKLTGPDVRASAFELFDVVLARDKEKAFGILDSLLKDGINSSQILGALAYKLTSDRGRVDAPFLERCLSELQKTDSDIKRGRQGQRIALELLLVKLLGLV